MRIKCDFCKGSGWETSEDPKTGEPIPVPCETCNGLGYIEVEEDKRGSGQNRSGPTIRDNG